MQDHKKLVEAAKTASHNSYSPYSRVKVGCAISDNKGRVFLGTNVENNSYGLTICAERAAIANAVSNGSKKFLAIAIYSERGFMPCGACRQVISEFVRDVPIYIAGRSKIKRFSLKSLLPSPFKFKII